MNSASSSAPNGSITPAALADHPQPPDTLPVPAAPGPPPATKAVPRPPAPAPPAAAQTTPKLRSKIGHLRRELRDLVHTLLADGATAAEVVQKLGQHGVPLSTQNVYDWFHGPHQLWLAEQRLLDESRLRQQLTLDLAREASGTDTFQGAQKIAAALIAEAVAQFGADTLRTALQSDPMNLFRALHALARLTAGDVKCERLLAQAADRRLKLKLAGKTRARKKGHTDKSLEECTDELNLL